MSQFQRNLITLAALAISAPVLAQNAGGLAAKVAELERRVAALEGAAGGAARSVPAADSARIKNIGGFSFEILGCGKYANFPAGAQCHVVARNTTTEVKRLQIQKIELTNAERLTQPTNLGSNSMYLGISGGQILQPGEDIQFSGYAYDNFLGAVSRVKIQSSAGLVVFDNPPRK